MNELYLTGGKLAVDPVFEGELERKRADGKFTVPASWGDQGRCSADPDYDTDVVTMWTVNYGELKKLSFVNPFAPYEANSGTIMCFKQPKSKTGGIGEMVTTVRDSRAEKKKARELESLSSYYSRPLLQMFQLKKTSIATGVAAFPVLHWTVPMIEADGGGANDVGLYIFMAMVAMFLTFMAIFILVDTISYSPHRVKAPKVKSPKAIASMNAKRVEESKGDEVFVVGVYSLVPEIAQISDSVALLVRNKLRMGGPAAEVQSWAETVLEITELQGLVAGGLPSQFIPLMNVDAKMVRDDLKNNVERVRREWVDTQQSEVMALEYGSSVVSELSMDDSRSAREGASKYLAGLTGEDFQGNIA